MKKRYRVAELEIEVSASDEIMFEDDRTLADFKINDEAPSSRTHCFIFKKTEALDGPEGEECITLSGYKVYLSKEKQIRYLGNIKQSWQGACMRVVHSDCEHFVQLKESEYHGSIGPTTALNAMAMEHLCLEVNGIILHASFVEHNGSAILFTAPSGAGKSTQAELWHQLRDADIINGDRAIMRLKDEKAFACGIPFAGSSKHCKNATMPLAAIVYLGHAKETTIDRLDFKSAFKCVWEGCTVNTWNPDDLNKAIDIVQQITFQVPVYHLQCTPDESAVIALESELNKL